MNINFGLFPPLAGQIKSPEGKRLRGGEKAAAKKAAMSARAAEDLETWLRGQAILAAE